MRAGPWLAEVAVFLQEQLQEERWERRSSERSRRLHTLAWERGKKERFDGKQCCKPCAVQKCPVIFFFLRPLHPKQPPLLCSDMFMCLLSIIFDGSWVFGHDMTQV